MESIEKTHRYCKYFDTYTCLLRKHHDLMDQIKLFCILPTSDRLPLVITEDEYFEVKEECDKVCAVCGKFERKETD